MSREFRILLVVACLSLTAPAFADSITVTRVSVTAQTESEFGTTNARLDGPIEMLDGNTGASTGAWANSLQICVSGDPECPTEGGSPVVGGVEIRFTDVDFECNLDAGNCGDVGVGFTFGGVLDGVYVFDWGLSDLTVTGSPVAGIISLELNIGGVYTHSFLSFYSLSGGSFGPVPSITVSGSNVPYTAYGILSLQDMPAGSRLQILHSAEFDFAPVPEPSSLVLLGSGLGVIGIVVRHRKG